MCKISYCIDNISNAETNAASFILNHSMPRNNQLMVALLICLYCTCHLPSIGQCNAFKAGSPGTKWKYPTSGFGMNAADEWERVIHSILWKTDEWLLSLGGDETSLRLWRTTKSFWPELKVFEPNWSGMIRRGYVQQQETVAASQCSSIRHYNTSVHHLRSNHLSISWCDLYRLWRCASLRSLWHMALLQSLHQWAYKWPDDYGFPPSPIFH